MSRPKKATKLSPAKPEARDEGPRLIPLSDKVQGTCGIPPIEAGGYASMADNAMAIWDRSDKKAKRRKH